MKCLTILCFFLLAAVVPAVGQTSNSNLMILNYHKVTEFVFDETAQNYVASDSFVVSGPILIGPKKIFIKGYNNNPDKTFKIIEFEKEEGTDRDMYMCEMNGEEYALAISPDGRYITQIGVLKKYIYQIGTVNVFNGQGQNITPGTEIVFPALSLEVKPVFGDAGTFEEGEKQLHKYLAAELEKQGSTKSGNCTLSIFINKEGKVEDVKLVYGKDYAFNQMAMENVRNMPAWKPGMQNGKPVNASYNLKIKKE